MYTNPLVFMSFVVILKLLLLLSEEVVVMLSLPLARAQHIQSHLSIVMFNSFKFLECLFNFAMQRISW